MTNNTKGPESDIFDQAVAGYQKALQTGLGLQEEAARCWTKLVNQAASPQDWQKQATGVANEAIPATQKAMEAYLELLRQNSHSSVDLVRKGVEASQTTSLVEGQGNLLDLCESSLKTLKANAQAIVDINSKAVDSWFGLVKKTTVSEVVGGHAQTA